MESILKQLRSGYIPTQSETENIRKDLVLLAEESHAQRDKVMETMQSKKALISPIQRLPDDLLREIFLACLSTDRNAVMSACEAPLLLCRICSVWRALALATPRIWASLHVHLSFLLQNDDRALAATEWVKRSAACPLAVSICGMRAAGHPGAMDMSSLLESEGERSNDHIAQGTLKSILQSAPRWRAVALSDLPGPCLDQLRTASMPLLQAVRIKSDELPLAQWLDVCAAPSVHRVDLDLVVVEEDASILVPRLSHITHLSMSGRPWPGIPGNIAVSILTTLTQLVSLNMFINDIPLISEGTTRLPSLKSLELHASAGSLPQLADMLDHFVMPKLHHLAVDSGVAVRSDAPLFATVTERSPLIETLEISLHNFTQEALRGTLFNFHSLVGIAVLNTKIWHPTPAHPNNPPPPANTEYLLMLLTREAPTLLPSLRALESKHGAGVPDETLFDFIESRVAAEVPFRLKVDYPFSHPLPDVERFRSQSIDVELTRLSPGWLPPPLDPWSGLPPI
ncbi:hypothetical protein C8R43DRAFT_1031579 [Mycena crocata]|nr:hypothetical protein C8R43DRAFT_1031579 [Mycena crocata]